MDRDLRYGEYAAYGMVAAGTAGIIGVEAAGIGGTVLWEGEAASGAAAVANKLIHIFGNAAHNLGPLVARFGTQEAAYMAVQRAAQAAVAAGGITGRFEIIVTVGGMNVTVRGMVIDGIARIGTFFIP